MSKSTPTPAVTGPEASSQPTPEGTPTDGKKKVYDRVLLWMLDTKPLDKDMRISPLIEVSVIYYMIPVIFLILHYLDIYWSTI